MGSGSPGARGRMAAGLGSLPASRDLREVGRAGGAAAPSSPPARAAGAGPGGSAGLGGRIPPRGGPGLRRLLCAPSGLGRSFVSVRGPRRLLPQRGSAGRASLPPLPPSLPSADSPIPAPRCRESSRHMTAQQLSPCLSFGGKKKKKRGKKNQWNGIELCSAEAPSGAERVWGDRRRLWKRRVSHNHRGVASSVLSAPSREHWKVVLTLSPPVPGPPGHAGPGPALGSQGHFCGAGAVTRALDGTGVPWGERPSQQRPPKCLPGFQQLLPAALGRAAHAPLPLHRAWLWCLEQSVSFSTANDLQPYTRTGI